MTDRTREFWETTFAQKGARIEALWGSNESQRVRFEALLRASGGSLWGATSLLDVGCGFGDLRTFLLSRGLAPRYVGIDMAEAAIAEATRRTSHGGFHLGSWDQLKDPLGYQDLIFASGLFGVRFDGWEDYVVRTLDEMFARAHMAVVVNFLSNSAPVRDEHSMFVAPEWALTQALRLTKRVKLLHDYRDNDFTLCLEK